MKRLWVRHEIEAPPATVWGLLSDPESWPSWGPTVRSAELRGDSLRSGATGTVTTVLGFGLPFVITEFDDGARWAWRVGGVAATDHTVDPLDEDRCRVGFGVPWLAAPYLAVCRVALRRLESMATCARGDE
ncbi:MAG: SRPBCC family protein [Actinomycetota bacterium]|nr:SRPBCC family protein [Actinomycetota bacterium]